MSATIGASAILRSGQVVDGGGAPAFAADERVADGRITEIGANLRPGRVLRRTS